MAISEYTPSYSGLFGADAGLGGTNPRISMPAEVYSPTLSSRTGFSPSMVSAISSPSGQRIGGTAVPGAIPVESGMNMRTTVPTTVRSMELQRSSTPGALPRDTTVGGKPLFSAQQLSDWAKADAAAKSGRGMGTPVVKMYDPYAAGSFTDAMAAGRHSSDAAKAMFPVPTSVYAPPRAGSAQPRDQGVRPGIYNGLNSVQTARANPPPGMINAAANSNPEALSRSPVLSQYK